MARKILIIDDDEVDRVVVSRALNACGLHMEIEEATDGEARLAALSRRTFGNNSGDTFLNSGRVKYGVP